MAQEIKPEPQAMVVTPPPGRMTYEEFLDWLDEESRAEWVDGEVELMSPVSVEHQELTRLLLVILSLFVEARRLGVVYYEPFQMKTSPELPGRSPDILFLSSDHLSRLRETYLDGPADLVVEIVSPGSRGRDRGDKYYEYEQGGVREYWLIDPLRKQAEFYHLGQDGVYQVVPVGADGIFRSIVLDGLWLRVDWLWQTPLPSALSVVKELGLV